MKIELEEKEVGEKFKLNPTNNELEVVENNCGNCDGCFFNDCGFECSEMKCTPLDRKDGKSVIYVSPNLSRYHSTSKDIKLIMDIKEARELYKQGGAAKTLVLKYFDEQQLIVKSNTWKEYCNKHNVCENVDEKAAVALYKLLQLRREWVGNWEPDWYGERTITYSYTPAISFNRKTLSHHYINVHYGLPKMLSFPTYDMLKKFLYTYSDLIEIAQPLIH